MKDTKIFVMAHKAFDVPENSIYVPVQVGSALHEDLGYTSDATGDNISAKNPCYNELTGLYWMWKNVDDCRIMGLCHYRRYFLNAAGDLMSGEEYEKVLLDADIIVTQKLCYPKGTSVYEAYAKKHHAKELDITRQAIAKLYPEYLGEYDSVINGRLMYFANMMVAKAEVIRDYAKWLFEILFEVEANLDISEYNDYDKRVYGFIAERLVMVWVKHNRLRVAEKPVGLVGEKSETTEVISNSARLMKDGNPFEVLEYLNSVKNSRPDLFFTDSDVKRELASIYTFAEIMCTENRAGKRNLMDYSTDYKVIMELCRDMKQLLECGDEGRQLYQFVEAKKLSVEFVMFWVVRSYDNSEQIIRIYNNLATNYLDAGNIHMAKLYVGLALREGKG